MTDTVTSVELPEMLVERVATAIEQSYVANPFAPHLFDRLATAALEAAALLEEIERLRGWVEDGYLEGYSQGMVAGSLVCREDDWLKSKAFRALQPGDGQ